MGSEILTILSLVSKAEPETAYGDFFNIGRKLYADSGCVTNIVYSGAGFSKNIGLSWNSQYQLTEVTTNGAAVERNGFDALGRRIWNWDGSSTNYMVYDGVHVLAEVDSTGGLRRAYTHGPGIDNWLAMTVYTGATAKTYFYLTDHQGTVHAVADETGSIVESYRFDSWGRVLGVYNGSGTPLAESAIGNKILWQGREYSWKTGLYFFRARFYDPIVGRWMSKDPAGIAGGLDQYVFCGDNPVNSRDPCGLCKEGSSSTTWNFLSNLNPFNMNGSLNNQVAAGFSMLMGDMQGADQLNGLSQLYNGGASQATRYAYGGSFGVSAIGVSGAMVANLFSAGAASVFYSGYPAAYNAALAEGGGTLITQTLGGRALVWLGVNSRTVWAAASAIYAANATGTAQVFVRGAQNLQNVWYTVEQPVLEFLGNASILYR
jgi:RHS repeat-associated protein